MSPGMHAVDMHGHMSGMHSSMTGNDSLVKPVAMRRLSEKSMAQARNVINNTDTLMSSYSKFISITYFRE